VGDQLSLSLAPVTKRLYQPRGINILQLLFKEHFQSFANQYEAKHAIIYGRFRIERITEVVEKFILCGDYTQGIARIQCTNSDCRYEYFRPFSCKSFYFCPSCSQKRTLLFSQYMNERLLLALPHRQFVFTFPKLLGPYFRHNRRLFSEISRLIFAILQRFYDRAARGRSGPEWSWRTSPQGSSYGGIRITTASCWKAGSMRGASLSISPLGISSGCRSISAG